jgi:hypothetical protein
MGLRVSARQDAMSDRLLRRAIIRGSSRAHTSCADTTLGKGE